MTNDLMTIAFLLHMFFHSFISLAAEADDFTIGEYGFKPPLVNHYAEFYKVMTMQAPE